MKIYSYCSYEGSPCGFVLGSFEFHTEAKEQQGLRFILQNDSVFGNLPDKDTYWIVVKDLNAKDEKPYRYLNFAFETKNLREYQILLAGILNGYNNRSKLISRFSDFIVLRREDTEFGLLICARSVQ